ncbi:MAG TPA: hypothetical protein PL124_11110, partial [Candidatus Cloacimonadota bacterium]|nr:hypothetical protein [Candidatus Cloacimonadota bacterium]
RILKSDLDRFGAKYDPNTRYSDLANLHGYYTKAESAGTEVLTAFKANLDKGMPIETAYADAEDAGKYRTKIAETMGKTYQDVYDKEVKAGVSPALAWNKVASQFDAAQPKPVRGGGGGGSNGSGGSTFKATPHYKGMKKLRVYNEPGANKSFVFGIGANTGKKLRWEVYENEDGQIMFVDTDTPVPLDTMQRIKDVKFDEYVSGTWGVGSTSQQGAKKKSPAQTGSGVVWE